MRVRGQKSHVRDQREVVDLLVEAPDPARAEDRDAGYEFQVGERNDELCDAGLPDLSCVSLGAPANQPSEDSRVPRLWFIADPAVDVQSEEEVLAQVRR